MRLIQLDRKYKYCWVWKFLITWHECYDSLTHKQRVLDIGYYPDYETPTHWLTVEVG